MARFIALVVLTLALCVGQTSATNLPVVCAHRGASGEFAENTNLAFREGFKQGAIMVELDLWPTADSQIAVIHDRTLDRTTNGTGPVSGVTLEEFRTLDAGSWFDGKYLPAPGFQDVIDMFWDVQSKDSRFLYLMLHIKTADPVLRALAAMPSVDKAFLQHVMLCVESSEAILQANELFGDTPKHCYVGDHRKWWDLGAPFSVYDVHKSVLQSEGHDWAEFVKDKRGRFVYAWTSNTPETAKADVALAMRNNWDGLVTDYPAITTKAIQAYAACAVRSHLRFDAGPAKLHEECLMKWDRFDKGLLDHIRFANDSEYLERID